MIKCTRPFVVVLVGLLLAAGGAGGEVRANELALAVEQIDLHPTDSSIRRIGELVYRGGFVLNSTSEYFGGISGFVVSADGEQFLAVSDRGQWVVGLFDYGGAGRLVGVSETRIVPVLKWNGRPLDFPENDLEAVSLTPAGHIVAAFERWHRIWRYDADMKTSFRTIEKMIPEPVIDLRQIAELPPNGGVESLAALEDGRLVAISENGKSAEGDTLAWVIEGDRADTFGYQTEGEFRPTDASQLPNGNLIVLERRYRVTTGPAARFVEVELASLEAGATVAGREIARLERPLAVDNMEGIAARRDVDGTTLIYVVSDNNFNPFQRTILMMFAWER